MFRTQQFLVVSWLLLTLSQESAVTGSVSAEAVAGKPFGIASVSVALKKPMQPLRDLPLMRITEAKGRVLYPVYSSDTTLLLALHRKNVSQLDAMFVFHGIEPLELTMTLRNGDIYRFAVNPVVDEKRHTALKEKWWRRYSQNLQGENGYGEPADAMNGYLASMLSRRLRRDPPRLPGYRSSNLDAIGYLVSFLSGTDSIRAAMQTDDFLWGTKRTEFASVPLPKGVTIPSIAVPEIPADVHIEPMAMHVPADCFYIRCGSFSNFVWMKSRLQAWGSQLRNMALRQPVDYRLQHKLERQLALQETVVSRLFGNRLVEDVAIIGADTLLRDGAALGILFQAENSGLLKSLIEAQREEARATTATATQRFIEIDGRDVSLLSTPENTVRSFHVVDGDFHFITNSETLARDFLRAGDGRNVLGRLEEFRHARHIMPATEKQTAFVYLSDPFFRRLVSPHYRIEMTRRMQAMTEIEAAQFARLAAKGELQPHRTVGELIGGGFLPREFRTRPDGSRTQFVNGEPIDSLRGRHGSFTPIPDVAISTITPSERKAYTEFADRYRRMWTRVDPVAVNIERTGMIRQRERVVFDLHITPYVRSQFGFLSAFLAAPTTQQMTRTEGDVIGGEAVVRGLTGIKSDDPVRSARFFAAAGDPEFQLTFTDGHIQELWPDTESWYLGSTPPDAFPHGQKTTPNEDGYFERKHSRMTFLPESFRFARIFNNNYVLTTSRERLERISPRLKVIDAERPAQIRFWVHDLDGTHLQRLADARVWLQLRRMSGRTATYLNRLVEQLRVPPEGSVAAAETLLQARLVDPLAGRFKLSGGDFPEWNSTAWKDRSLYNVKQVPEEYHFPLVHQLHGLEIEFRIDSTTIEARVQLDLDDSAFQAN